MGFSYAGRLLEAIIDTVGNAQPTASVLVRVAGTATSATLYTDRTKVTAASNPATVASGGIDSEGNLGIYVDPGLYDLQVTVGAAVRTKRVAVSIDPTEVSLVLNAETFAVAADAGDDALAVQRAIDYAESLLTAGSRPPCVQIPPGISRWRTPISWKWAPLVGSDLITSLIYWDGAAGATVISRDPTVGNSYFLIQGLLFDQGTAEPATWIDTTAAIGQIDKFSKLDRLQFGQCSSDAIKIGDWVNLHWTDLRIDHSGGYAIRATPSSTQSHSVFCLERFTYDHTRVSGAGTGFLMVDDTAGGSVPGVILLKGGRVEVNTAWAGNKALVVDKASPSAGTRVHLEDIEFAVAAGTANIVYRDGAGSPVLSMESVGLDGAVTPVAGDLPAQYPTLPTRSFYQLAGVSSDYAYAMAAGTGGVGLDVFMSSWGSKYPHRVFFAAEAEPRWRMTEAGQMEWGPGSVAPDTTLARSAAAVLALNGGFEYTEQGADLAAPAANKARLYVKDNGSGKTQLVVRFPTGAVQVIATEP